MGRKSKTLIVTIHGKTTSDLIIALDEVKRWIEKEALGGTGSNDTGDYYFDITEEDTEEDTEEED